MTVPDDSEGHELEVHGVDGICATEDPLVLGLISATGADGEQQELTGPSDGLVNVCQ